MDTARTVAKHERVGRALEQINGLRYRKTTKEELRFDSDDEAGAAGTDSDAGSDADSDADSAGGGDGGANLSLDEHIEQILRRTRTIALLKIANNTAEIVAPEDVSDEDDEGDDGFDSDCYVSIEESDDERAESRGEAAAARPGSFRKLASMRKPSAVFHPEDAEETAAAHRLAKKLSSYLCLPRVISYRDLEAITETLLDERHAEGEEYADLIDYHVESARDSASAGDCGAPLDDAGEAPIWKRRHSRPVGPLDVSESPGDLEMHQRRLFMEANQFGRFSSRNFFMASSRSLVNKQSMRRLGSSSSFRLGAAAGSPMVKKASSRSVESQESRHSLNGAAVAEEADSGEDEEEAAADGRSGAGDPEDKRGSIFLEEDYIQWRTDIKEDYLAWIRAKVEAAKRRKARARKEAGKKPRWLLLYEASKLRPRDGARESK